MAVVIAPWNFPLAILTGMATAAARHRQHGHHEAGRAVGRHRREADGVLCKPRACRRASSNFLPGVGEEIGPTLVNHPDVALIAFTGSLKVGLLINEQAVEDAAAGRTT